MRNEQKVSDSKYSEIKIPPWNPDSSSFGLMTYPGSFLYRIHILCVNTRMNPFWNVPDLRWARKLLLQRKRKLRNFVRQVRSVCFHDLECRIKFFLSIKIDKTINYWTWIKVTYFVLCLAYIFFTTFCLQVHRDMRTGHGLSPMGGISPIRIVLPWYLYWLLQTSKFGFTKVILGDTIFIKFN